MGEEKWRKKNRIEKKMWEEFGFEGKVGMREGVNLNKE